MAHIRTNTLANSKKTYTAIVKDGRTNITKTFKTKGAASKWAKRVEGDTDLVAAHGSIGASVTFQQLIDEHIESDCASIPKAHLGFWLNHIGGTTKLLDIKKSDITAGITKRANMPAYRHMGKNKKAKNIGATKPATVNRYRSSMSALFKYAIAQYDAITTNPVHGTATKTENNRRIRYLSDKERDVLLEACKASEWERMHLLVVLGITAGGRLGDLINLRWCDIDFDRRVAHVAKTKNGEPRTMTLPPVAVNLLMPFRAVGKGYVFPSEICSDQSFEFRKHWNKARTAAELNDFKFHDLRHTCASYLAQNGATLLEIGGVLGHKSLQTTLRYAHLCIDSKQQLTDRVFSGIMGDG